jgi:hypothetical protein
MTAVEWFYQRILAKDIKEVFEKAKEMEKEQIRMAFTYGHWNGQFKKLTSEEYYEKTYNK